MAKFDYEAIKLGRANKDITQKKLSELSGINLNTIKSIETGRMTPDIENINRICEVLELCAEEVYNPDFRDTKVISVVNNKGGCGKTSITGSLGYCLAEMGYKILLVDSDAQRNLSSSLNVGKTPQHFGKAVIHEESLIDYIVETEYENIDFIPSDVSMGTLDMVMFTKMHRENIVSSILSPVVEAGRYDFIIIDTNPNLSLLNFNVVNASDYCIIPVQPAGFDVEGIVTVIDFIKGIQRFNHQLSILGIVINRYDRRNKTISEAALEELTEAYGSLLFETVIQTDVKIQNAQWENVPVFSYNSSRIAKEYRTLAKEVVKRCQL